jgi:hypothetical protein
MKKPSLWTRGIVDILERSQDLELEDSNQPSEAIFKNLKHNQNIKNDLNEVGQYVLRRHQDSIQECQLCLHQLDEAKASRKHFRGETQDTNAGNGESEVARDFAESTTNIGWGKNPTRDRKREALRTDLQHWRHHLGSDLRTMTDKFKVLLDFIPVAGVEKKPILAYNTFCGLLNGMRSAPNTVDIVQKAYDEAKATHRKNMKMPEW